ncbi:hypothetical protein CCH79_00015699 [Gambusia affinis]|uniref:C-type lectin domain-containing protein n=1 Tax=Gambusia affinis TaxID=33528 RepID=A0A315WFP9_GAMAF|nr:hypothetical protein CCH79_00015699 [Gambusia affinis]
MMNIFIFVPLMLVLHFICGDQSPLREGNITFHDEHKTLAEAQAYCRTHHTDLITSGEKTDLPSNYKGWIGQHIVWIWSSGGENKSVSNWQGSHNRKQNIAKSQQTRLNTLTFKYYSVWATWQQAQSACREQHSDLTTIRNRTELQAYSGGQGWIGLYRKSDDGPWKWSSGEDIATFFNWETDNPKSGEHCVYQFQGKWTSDRCDVKHT